jgi:two-component system, OmpR family, response regulator
MASPLFGEQRMVTEAIKEIEFDGLSSCPLPESARSHADCGAADLDQCRPTGVLVIEDERLMLKAMEQGLRKRGFVVWAAPDGGEGVDLYRRFGSQIDVVLSDVQMPVLDGPKTLDALREINPCVRFCFMTGDTRSATLTNLLRRGAMRVFTKPFPVAGVAEELWELATRPYDFSARPELGDDESAGPERTAAASHPEEEPVGGRFLGWAFAPLLRSAASIGLPLGKTLTPTPSALPPT